MVETVIMSIITCRFGEEVFADGIYKPNKSEVYQKQLKPIEMFVLIL